jgi:hypothetical protein
VSVDSRVSNRGSRSTIRHRQDDGSIDNRESRPREFQENRIYTHRGDIGVREEDLVVLLYFLLASAYIDFLVIEGYSPEIVDRRSLAVDAIDKEIIVFIVERSEIFEFRFRWRGGRSCGGSSLTHRNRTRRLCCRRLVQWCTSAPRRGYYCCWFRRNDEFRQIWW